MLTDLEYSTLEALVSAYGISAVLGALSDITKQEEEPGPYSTCADELERFKRDGQ